MALNLVNFEQTAQEAIKSFWLGRDTAKQKQLDAGRADQGERASVTGGKNMNGFAGLVIDAVRANGLADAHIHERRALLTLPGYFRPTKLWDLVVMHQGNLIAAIEMKSHVGPSFGNNFNNRTEESIGTGHDFWTAYREGAFGAQPRPFVGWMMLVEDAPGSRRPVNDAAPHFPVFSAFRGVSYLHRYDVLCQRLMSEQLYSAATVIASPRNAASTGAFQDMSRLTGLKAFVAGLAGHSATVAAQGR